MAYNEFIADRIRQSLTEKNAEFSEKRMFGGLCFMVDEKMCIGIHGNDELMARIGPNLYEVVLQKGGAKEMKFTSHPMKGYVTLEAAAFDSDERLDYWVQLCLDFNPLAKKSKKRKKKN